MARNEISIEEQSLLLLYQVWVQKRSLGPGLNIVQDDIHPLKHSLQFAQNKLNDTAPDLHENILLKMNKKLFFFFNPTFAFIRFYNNL